ncbi:hypothetical protein ACLKA7_002877 [Drosophila subpalustris]
MTMPKGDRLIIIITITIHIVLDFECPAQSRLISIGQHMTLNTSKEGERAASQCQLGRVFEFQQGNESRHSIITSHRILADPVRVLRLPSWTLT